MILDSGTSLIYMPQADYNWILAALKQSTYFASKCSTTLVSGYLACPCSSTTDQNYFTIFINLGGYAFYM